ncbi:hypothetical protein VNO78_28949 [Psophocarpus tetragonolobus]|uniref:Uncharacterized protein n=1 Tax=Psophocarpus tetragonolobus TaxID=3891 RepID=A0AAN9RU24_PSOTE
MIVEEHKKENKSRDSLERIKANPNTEPLPVFDYLFFFFPFSSSLHSLTPPYYTSCDVSLVSTLSSLSMPQNLASATFFIIVSLTSHTTLTFATSLDPNTKNITQVLMVVWPLALLTTIHYQSLYYFRVEEPLGFSCSAC